MIEKHAFIANNNGEVFWDQVVERINEMQAADLEVEIQYSPAVHGQIVFTAAILGRSKS